MQSIFKNKAQEILCFTGGVLKTNSYLFISHKSNSAFLVDPGPHSDIILNYVIRNSFRIDYIFCTHGHFDHIHGASLFQNIFKCPVFLSEFDLNIARHSNLYIKILGHSNFFKLPEFSFIEPGKCIDFNGKKIFTIGAPGHTPGSVIVACDKVWFTGDTMYTKGVGVTGGADENQNLLRQSLTALWPQVAEVDLIAPGHGAFCSGSVLTATNQELKNFICCA